MGDEAYHRYLMGDFDEQLVGFKKHLESGGKQNDVPDELIIRKSNGTKFGQNGKNAMMAMLEMFEETIPGMAPKMRNYAKNISGRSDRPTIDVWAARTMQRLMHELDPKPLYARPIPEFNTVGGEHIKPNALRTGQWKGEQRPEITQEYGLALEVFEAAAVRLDMPPNNLQAMMWFAEKELWEANRWTPPDSSANLSDLFAKKHGLLDLLSESQLK